MRVGIVGAGAAGLAAAYDLTAAGHSVTVYESAPFIGGQASTIPVGGYPLERGYHHLFTNDLAIIGLINELGLQKSLQWFPSTVGTFVAGRVYRTTTPLDILRFSAVPFADRVKLGMMAVRLQRHKDWRTLEQFTADGWLRQRLGGKAYEAVWNPLLRGKFGAQYDKVGMPWLWSKIQTRVASRKGIGGEKLGYPVKSFDEVFNALRARIESRGARVFTDTPVEQVLTADGAANGLRARRRDGATVEERFDAVLMTAPSFAIPGLVDLPPGYRARLEGVHYLAAVVLILELTHPLTRYYWMNIADRSVPFLGIIEHTNMLPAPTYGGSHVVYLTNYLDRTDPVFSLSSGGLLDLYLPHLTRFNPAFERGWVKAVHYNSLSAAQPVIGAGYSARMPAHRTPVKRLYLANTTQIYPEDRGTNYSVRMGRDVAKLMIEDAR
jgi:protoporphyrinogen oxidase